MNYDEVVAFLYSRLPMFTRDGASAFKKDLTNTLRLCEALGNPHKQFRSIHIAGTNGKGSTSHMLAAILQAAGYKTGLYTSPHLLDFRERIRVNGEMVSQQAVVDFVHGNLPLIEIVEPSFFEVTVAMAFDYFAKEGVDIAVVETGLGGRLDSTNVITPLLSVITNIGYDHTNMLGNTLQEIANEKAGIIKPKVPVVIGEWQPEVAGVFERIATEKGSDLFFASQLWTSSNRKKDSTYLFLDMKHRHQEEILELRMDLTGSYQAKNVATVLCAVDSLKDTGIVVKASDITYALQHVQRFTGLMGRWQTLSTAPLVVCDTGHNADGWREILANISATPYRLLHVVVGMMRDKDLDSILPLLPKDAIYYFCQVDMPRALPATALRLQAKRSGLVGKSFAKVSEAIRTAKQEADASDLIFIGGSTFVVAEALSS